jgi:hypothetical protein
MPPDVPAALVRWERVLGDLLDRTQRFPKAARFTFAARVDGLALDVLDSLVQARWTPPIEKAAHLRAADLGVARLRVLLRLCHARRLLDTRGWEHMSRELDEVGRMLGGWLGAVGQAQAP